MLGFRDLTIVDAKSQRTLLHDVSGFVVKGGVTGIIGPSSSGKTLLMKALAGRVEDAYYTGDVVLDGRVLDSAHSRVAFEDDQLVGVLTLRESLELSMQLRRNVTRAECAEAVKTLIDNLELTHVADNAIGTVLKRGLSGGQKRRTSVGVELVANSSVIFIDEPTSGLDAAAALHLMTHLRELARRSNGALSIVVSVQQPGLPMLRVLDHVLLLGRSGMVFFGTLPEARTHFTELGFPPPHGEPPTDHYLALTDTTFVQGRAALVDFDAHFHESTASQQMHDRLRAAIRAAENVEDDPAPIFETSGWSQFKTLLRRNMLIAYRDPTVYYLQLFLHSFYGFLIGAVFYKLTPTFSNINDMFSGVTWLVFLQAYMHVFKVHYLDQSNKRFHHEYANKMYGVFAYWSAEFLATAICSLVFLPGITIAYFMMGLPGPAFGLTIIATYFLALASEGMIHFITQFSREAAYAVVAAQSALILLCVFTTGSLITENNVPGWWVWVQELSFFAHSSRAIAHSVLGELTYSCVSPATTIVGTNCQLNGQPYLFPCIAGTTCDVRGVDVLHIFKGLQDTPMWLSFLYLVLLSFFFRLGTLVLYRFPFRRFWLQRLQGWTTSTLRDMVFDGTINTQRLQREVGMLKLRLNGLDVSSRAAITIQRVWRSFLNLNRFKKAVYSVIDSKKNHVVLDMRPVSASALIWKNLTLSLSNGKVLIDNVEGYALGGRVLALMGPSGAGKTTLLNALSGRAPYAAVQGQVWLNGRPMRQEDLKYVPQFDDLNERFTVRELLTATGQLQAPADPAVMRRRVAKLLSILGLNRQADMTSGQLTGGQRKRVSIGLGLVGEPKVLFLDEPTTGLDSSSALNIVKYISAVARATNVVCIMTIHQPAAAVFNSLDDLYLLETGRLVYFGRLDKGSAYFSSLNMHCTTGCNPADYYLDLISTSPQTAITRHTLVPPPGMTSTTTWSGLYHASQYAEPVTPPKGTPSARSPAVSEVKRFFIMLQRLVTFNARAPEYYLRAIQLVLIGLYLGTLYLRLPKDTSRLTELSGASFFNIWVVLFSVVASVPALARDRRLVQQEVANGSYRYPTHTLAHFLASVPFNLLCAILYQCVFHYLVGFNDLFSAWVYSVAMSLALMLVMEAIVLCVIEALKDAMLSVTFSMILLGMLFLFAGYFIHADKMPPSVRWITWLMPSRYALDGSLNNVFADQQYFNPATGTSFPGEFLLTSVFGHTSDTIAKWPNFVVVLAWTVLFRLAHLAMTLFNNRSFGRAPAGTPPQATTTTATTTATETIPLQPRGVAAAAVAGSAAQGRFRPEDVLVVDVV